MSAGFDRLVSLCEERGRIVESQRNEINRLMEHSIRLNRTGWRLAEVLGYVVEDDDRYVPDCETWELVDRLADERDTLSAAINDFLNAFYACGMTIMGDFPESEFDALRKAVGR